MQEKNQFIDGLFRVHLPIDEEVFEEIRQVLTLTVGAEGHDYIPDPLEYRVSSIPYCKRKIFFKKRPDQFLNSEQLIMLETIYEEDSKLNVSSVGQLIHEVFQEALISELGAERLKMEEEVSMKIGDAVLKGHYDLLIKTKGGEEVVIDIKTTSSSPQFLPKPGHLIQLMAYQGILGGVRGGILYVNRNNFDLNYYPQNFSKEDYSEIIKKVSNLARYERNGELPPREPELTDECGNLYFKCEYYSICYAKELANLTLNPTSDE